MRGEFCGLKECINTKGYIDELLSKQAAFLLECYVAASFIAAGALLFF